MHKATSFVKFSQARTKGSYWKIWKFIFQWNPLVSITVRLLLPLDRANRVAAAALRSTARMRWGFILGWLPTASHSALLFRQCAAHSASVRTAPTFHCRFRSGLSEHSPPEQRRLGRALPSRARRHCCSFSSPVRRCSARPRPPMSHQLNISLVHVQGANRQPQLPSS
jgi:hypothetical protein